MLFSPICFTELDKGIFFENRSFSPKSYKKGHLIFIIRKPNAKAFLVLNLLFAFLVLNLLSCPSAVLPV